MFIRTEQTPNPNTLKFLTGKEIMPMGSTLNVSNAEEAKQSLLAEELMAEAQVKAVFFGNDFIAITIDDHDKWDVVQPILISSITSYIASERPIITAQEKAKPKVEFVPNEGDEEIVGKIVELINERVRPAVAMDGGDIIFHSYADGVVHLTLHGSCQGCPSASLTLKQGIENMLKYYFPDDIKEVIAVE